MDLRDHLHTIKRIFVDEYNEISFKKCVNIYEFGTLLKKKGINMDPMIAENIGPIMMCFGDIQFEIKLTYRLPDESEDERRAVALKAMKEAEEKKAALEGVDLTKKVPKGKPKADEKKEEVKEETKEAPKAPVISLPFKIWLYLTSAYDLINSLEKMHDYDHTLGDLGLMTYDLSYEKEKLMKNT